MNLMLLPPSAQGHGQKMKKMILQWLCVYVVQGVSMAIERGGVEAT